MPLLIHAAGWWLLGLFVGATFGEPAMGSPWLARVESAAAFVVAMLFAGLAARPGWRARHVGGLTSLTLAGLGLAGVFASASATHDARLCRAAAVERVATGAGVTLAFEGATTERDGAAPRRRRHRADFGSDSISATAPPVFRGRGTLRFNVGSRGCTVAASVRLAGGVLRAGDIAVVRGRALATDRGVRLAADSAEVPIGRDWLRAARGRTGETIDRLFGERAALVRALVIADQDGIATAVRDRFADAGLVHMLSVSGMHVAIIASALLTITAAMRLPATVGAVASLALILAYVAMLGAPAPAVRSAVMLLTVMLSTAWQRPVHEWTALALGAVIPTVQPLVVLDLGWQLSVSGMAALVAARAILRRWQPYALALPPSSRGGLSGVWRAALRDTQRWLVTRRGIARWLVRETITGVVATVVTAPLIAWTFGRVSVLAPLTNILAGPLVAFLQPALFLALLASPLDPMAKIIADASALPIALLDRIAAAAAAMPYAVVHVAPTLSAAIGAGLASVAVVRATAARRAGPWLRLAVAALVLAVWLPTLTVGAGVLELHMIDVGQGDAFALRTPRGRWVLIDAGPSWDGGDAGRRAVIPYVQRRGGAVALMVLSHAHEDHVGGAASVITALSPRQWWEPAFVTSSSGYRKALVALRDSGQPWRRVHPGQRWQLDGVSIEVLAPDSTWTAMQHDANETSVVLRVSYGRRRFLFMGDAEQQEERWLLDRLPDGALRADVLKLGHHGSRTSSGPDFVRAVDPLVGLVSVGAGNSYRHPSPEVLERFANRRVPLLRSDLEGAVVVSTNGQWLDVTAHGDRWRIPERPAVPP
ncbi:DNA internalization-related competence protein ComEC/Rec2 [Gemmatimonas groenlandica]|uniref:DNA internalization-related competence protein ComEC/Rec2 n=1 Tax=Gemmatimonas groenlandica TaxID=2732249 RepID=A0A6M4IR14_9BACT|nr:DNA internalization-related competence protein ComEC/Rec2 [Gemmatimonas groenlandica]QJR35282.1 DNA internalization-related competence protein ComEC/Rec2 [Gemmatimonas groenlandica]